jgi:hypothetical protein
MLLFIRWAYWLLLDNNPLVKIGINQIGIALIIALEYFTLGADIFVLFTVNVFVLATIPSAGFRCLYLYEA